MKSKIFLSKRNLLALLSKLERAERGDNTACTIVKHKQPGDAYQQTMESIEVTAVSDEAYYGSQNRPAGMMHPDDEIFLQKPSTGVEPHWTM